MWFFDGTINFSDYATCYRGPRSIAKEQKYYFAVAQFVAQLVIFVLYLYTICCGYAEVCIYENKRFSQAINCLTNAFLRDLNSR